MSRVESNRVGLVTWRVESSQKNFNSGQIESSRVELTRAKIYNSTRAELNRVGPSYGSSRVDYQKRKPMLHKVIWYSNESKSWVQLHYEVRTNHLLEKIVCVTFYPKKEMICELNRVNPGRVKSSYQMNRLNPNVKLTDSTQLESVNWLDPTRPDSTCDSTRFDPTRSELYV